MADLTDAEKRALLFYGPIEAGVRGRESTAQIWQRVRDHAAALGLDRAGVGAAAVSKLRGIAGGQRSAMERLVAAPDEYAMDASMIGRQPWSRGLQAQQAVGMWQARFELHTIQDGELVTEWKTTMFTHSMPQTKAELRAALHADGQGIARDYELEFAGIGAFDIAAV